MGKKLTTFEKLRRSFEAIGVTLSSPDEDGFIAFEYDKWPYLLGIFEDEEIFYLTEYIVASDGNPPKHIFESALDITKSYHKSIEGEWSEQCSWISTPYYSMKGRRNIPKTHLTYLLKEFFEAHTFMETNIFMLMDETIWGNLTNE